MAHVWFDILEDLEDFKKGSIDQIQKDLDGVTLIGEYIGSQEH
jgi:hypothetical protein